MITYDQCFPEHQLNQLKKLVNTRRFSSIAKVIEYAIISLLTEHAVWGHIAPYEPHTSQPLIEKGFYLNEKEFVRMSVRELLKRKKTVESKHFSIRLKLLFQNTSSRTSQTQCPSQPIP